MIIVDFAKTDTNYLNKIVRILIIIRLFALNALFKIANFVLSIEITILLYAVNAWMGTIIILEIAFSVFILV